MSDFVIVLDCRFNGIRLAQFFSHNIHMYWSVNSKANSIWSDSNDRYHDIVPDQNSFAWFPREDQHGIHSLMMHNVAAEESLLLADNFPDASPRQPTKLSLNATRQHQVALSPLYSQ
jgi:hypothetical protein